MNDNYYDSSSQEVANEEYYDGEDYENIEQQRFLSDKILMWSALGVSLLVLVILVVWFFSPRDTSMNPEQLKILESRVGELESKIRRFDKFHENLIRLENQTKKFAHTIDRFDEFQTSTALRMDVLAKELVALQNSKSEIKPVVPQVPESESRKAEISGKKYHIVKAGETLYSISRGYGLSVDALRKFNNIKNDITIYPGQKLVVEPGNQQ